MNENHDPRADAFAFYAGEFVLANDARHLELLLRGAESILARSLRYGLLRAEAEQIVRDINAARMLPATRN